jgi:hypothetical protein
MDQIEPWAWDMLELADLAEKPGGTWPEAGGINDQTVSFVATARWIWNESARLKADRQEE